MKPASLVLTAALVASLSVLAPSPAVAWHAETFPPPKPLPNLKNLSVHVGQKAWVFTARTLDHDEVDYYSWYLDVGDESPGTHRGAEYLLVWAPGDYQLYTLPTADQTAIGSAGCAGKSSRALTGRQTGRKLRVPQACLAGPDGTAPEQVRVQLAVSAGSAVSVTPRSGRDAFHGFVDNVDNPATRVGERASATRGVP